MANFPISRRTVLKGLGVSMALPFLEAMLPKLAYSQQAAAATLPRRMAFCYVPHGVLTRDWTVTGTGANFTLSKILQPLQPYKQDILVMSGLSCDKARPHYEGAAGGDHARASACLLTGVSARRSVSDLRVGISVDQLAARHIGNQTRFSSLEIGCEGGRQAGQCDAGYACAYSSNLSWLSESTPAPKETNPRAVFDRLFASNNAADNNANQQRRERYSQSILDFIREDARSLERELGFSDRRRVEEFLSSIRDLERRISAFPSPQAAQHTLERPADMRLQGEETAARGGLVGDGGVDIRMHLRAMGDVLAVAFQTDRTRVATFVFSNEISQRTYPFLGVTEGHHGLTHHQFDPVKMDKCSRVNQFHMEQFAYLVGRLKDMREGAGSVLDNCMVMYGSGIGDGALHNHDDLPIVLAGKGGGTITSGRHVRYPFDTPICNLYLEMLDRMIDVRVNTFGDSTGRLRNLSL